MDLYLDTEFDGHGGDLISLAIAAKTGANWYGIFSARCQNGWVAEHVAPHLYAMPPTISGNRETLRASLREFLLSRSGATLWADWPADFEHLMHLMSGENFEGSFMIPCTMQLIVTPVGEPRPVTPHNALSDAIALMTWHQSINSETQAA